MKSKIPHGFYCSLLIAAVVITISSVLICEPHWNAIVISVGAGGIASVVVAWLLDWRNSQIQKENSRKKYDAIIKQFVDIYRRLLWVTANECFGFYMKDEQFSFEEWLNLLKASAPYCPADDSQKSMKTRCKRIAGNLSMLQKQIDAFQLQSATLIFEEFPHVADTQKFFQMQWTHCWGTIKMLEAENYIAFCDTTLIIFNEFINKFPEYKDCFPEKYNPSSWTV